MKKIGLLVDSIINEDMIKKLADIRCIEISEAREIFSNLSFSEYCKLSEASADITPPSGQQIGPTVNAPSSPVTGIKSVWPGKGTPVNVGMTVGLKGPSGLPVPGQVSQVDLSANGVKVKNPTTGQDEWTNMDSLEPYVANQQQQATTQQASSQPQVTAEEQHLRRLQELAGISENCSAGATGAGAIAIAPTSLGSVQKRRPTEEGIDKEYTPKEAPKTIIGDTKPSQASGELSATLAANGKKTAARKNNGFKK